MDANTTTAHQIKGHFHKVISGIAFVVVHDACTESNAIIIISGARGPKLLINLHIHFMILVISCSGDHLEGFVKAIRDENRTINILLEIGGNGSLSTRGDNHAISEATTTKQIEFGLPIVKGYRSGGSSLESVEGRSTAYGERRAALGDHRATSARN